MSDFSNLDDYIAAQRRKKREEQRSSAAATLGGIASAPSPPPKTRPRSKSASPAKTRPTAAPLAPTPAPDSRFGRLPTSTPPASGLEGLRLFGGPVGTTSTDLQDADAQQRLAIKSLQDEIKTMDAQYGSDWSGRDYAINNLENLLGGSRTDVSTASALGGLGHGFSISRFFVNAAADVPEAFESIGPGLMALASASGRTFIDTDFWLGVVGATPPGLLASLFTDKVGPEKFLDTPLYEEIAKPGAQQFKYLFTDGPVIIGQTADGHPLYRAKNGGETADLSNAKDGFMAKLEEHSLDYLLIASGVMTGGINGLPQTLRIAGKSGLVPRAAVEWAEKTLTPRETILKTRSGEEVRTPTSHLPTVRAQQEAWNLISKTVTGTIEKIFGLEERALPIIGESARAVRKHVKALERAARAENARQTRPLKHALSKLKPVEAVAVYLHATGKKPSEWTDFIKDRRAEAEMQLEQYVAQRESALDALNSLGGESDDPRALRLLENAEREISNLKGEIADHDRLLGVMRSVDDETWDRVMTDPKMREAYTQAADLMRKSADILEGVGAIDPVSRLLRPYLPSRVVGGARFLGEEVVQKVVSSIDDEIEAINQAVAKAQARIAKESAKTPNTPEIKTGKKEVAATFDAQNKGMNERSKARGWAGGQPDVSGMTTGIKNLTGQIEADKARLQDLMTGSPNTSPVVDIAKVTGIDQLDFMPEMEITRDVSRLEKRLERARNSANIDKQLSDEIGSLDSTFRDNMRKAIAIRDAVIKLDSERAVDGRYSSIPGTTHLAPATHGERARGRALRYATLLVKRAKEAKEEGEALYERAVAQDPRIRELVTELTRARERMLNRYLSILFKDTNPEKAERLRIREIGRLYDRIIRNTQELERAVVAAHRLPDLQEEAANLATAHRAAGEGLFNAMVDAYKIRAEKLGNLRMEILKAQNTLDALKEARAWHEANKNKIVGGPNVQRLIDELDQVFYTPFTGPKAGRSQRYSRKSGQAPPKAPGSTRQNRAIRILASRWLPDPRNWENSFAQTIGFAYAMERNRFAWNVADDVGPNGKNEGWYWVRQKGAPADRALGERGDFASQIDEFIEGDRTLEDMVNQDMVTRDPAVKARWEEEGTTNLRQLSPGDYHRIFGDIKSSSNVLVKILDKATDFWRALTLAYRPAWLVNNFVGQTLLYAIDNFNPNGVVAYAKAVLETIEEKRSRVPRVEPVPHKSRAGVETMARGAGLDDAQVSRILETGDARARAWAVQNGKDPREWWAKILPDFEQLPIPGALFHIVPRGFYSYMEKTIESKMPEQASVDQVRGILKKNQVPEEEIKWSGIEEYLAELGDAPVRRDSLIQFLQNGGVKIEHWDASWYGVDPDYGDQPGNYKYSRWVTPGPHTNYSENLFTWEDNPSGVDAKQYDGGHYPSPTLIHTRQSDRTIEVDGKPKDVLFVEEIQSDWHQAARAVVRDENDNLVRRGYGGLPPEEVVRIETEIKDLERTIFDKRTQVYSDPRWRRASEEYKAAQAELVDIKDRMQSWADLMADAFINGESILESVRIISPDHFEFKLPIPGEHYITAYKDALTAGAWDLQDSKGVFNMNVVLSSNEHARGRDTDKYTALALSRRISQKFRNTHLRPDALDRFFDSTDVVTKYFWSFDPDRAARFKREAIANKEITDHATAIKNELETEVIGEETTRVRELYAKLGENERAIPHAPFKNNWHEVALKSLVQKAIREGKDGIAWTSGAMQTERYNSAMSHVSNLSYNREKNLLSFDTDSGPQEHQVMPDALPNYVGHETSARLLDGEIVDEIKMNSTGMVKFYDEIVPKAANKILKGLGTYHDSTRISGRGKLQITNMRHDVDTMDQRAAMYANAEASDTLSLMWEHGLITDEEYYDLINIKEDRFKNTPESGINYNQAVEPFILDLNNYAAEHGMDWEIEHTVEPLDFDDSGRYVHVQTIVHHGSEGRGLHGVGDVSRVHTIIFDKDNPDLKDHTEMFRLWHRVDGDPAGAVTFKDGQAILQAFKAANFETFLHEIGHIIRRDLDPTVQKALLSHYGGKKRAWGVDEEEAFARDFAAWAEHGRRPPKRMQYPFRVISSWLRYLWAAARGKDGVHPKVRRVLDKNLLGESTKKQTPYTPYEFELGFFGTESSRVGGADIYTVGSSRAGGLATQALNMLGAAAAQERKLRSAITRFNSVLSDEIPRRAQWIRVVKKNRHWINRVMGIDASVKELREILRQVQDDPANVPADLKKIHDQLTQQVYDVLIDFGDMSSFEKSVIRRVFPFYSWFKGITRATLLMGLRDPLKVEMLNILGEIGVMHVQDEVGRAEKVLKSFYPLGHPSYRETDVGTPIGMVQRGLNTGGINPFGSPAQVVRGVTGLFQGEVRPTDNLALMMNPIFQTGTEVASMTDLFSGEKLEGSRAEQVLRRLGASFPQFDLATELIDPRKPIGSNNVPRQTLQGGHVTIAGVDVPLAVMRYMGIPLTEKNITRARALVDDIQMNSVYSTNAERQYVDDYNRINREAKKLGSGHVPTVVLRTLNIRKDLDLRLEKAVDEQGYALTDRQKLDVVIEVAVEHLGVPRERLDAVRAKARRVEREGLAYEEIRRELLAPLYQWNSEVTRAKNKVPNG